MLVDHVMVYLPLLLQLVDHLCGTWRPVVDGPGGFLPESPWVMREKKQFKPVPEFVGFTDHDGFYGMYGCK